MTKKKPAEQHKRRGPKPKGRVQVSLNLSPEAVAILNHRSKRLGISRGEFVERLLFEHLGKAPILPDQNRQKKS